MTLGRRAHIRVFIGLLVVLAHVVFQPDVVRSLVLCTEPDGRTLVEFGAAGYCQHPASVAEEGTSATPELRCPECSDRTLKADTTVARKRGEMPRTILPTGPPNQDVIAPFFSEALAAGGRTSVDLRLRTSADFQDPFHVSLRTTRLLI